MLAEGEGNMWIGELVTNKHSFHNELKICSDQRQKPAHLVRGSFSAHVTKLCSWTVKIRNDNTQTFFLYAFSIITTSHTFGTSSSGYFFKHNFEFRTQTCSLFYIKGMSTRFSVSHNCTLAVRCHAIELFGQTLIVLDLKLNVCPHLLGKLQTGQNNGTFCSHLEYNFTEPFNQNLQISCYNIRLLLLTH